MSFLDQLFPVARRPSELSSGYSVWESLLSLGKSASGVTVTADSSQRQATVYACVRVLSETVAQLPLQVFERIDGGRRRAPEHPLEVVLAGQPNPWQTSFEFREMMQGHVALRGNAYAEIKPGILGAVSELWPLHPGRVQVERLSNYRLRYEVTEEDGKKRYLMQDEVFHLRNQSADGLTGISPIQYARDSIGLTLAAERYGSKFFSNAIKPSGMLSSDTPIKRVDAEAAQRTLMESQAGEENWHKPIVMWGGLKWQSIGMTNDDAQFIDTLKRGDTQACQIFRMPPHMVGILDRSTNNNIEQQSLEFVTYTLMPWIRRWEEAIGRDLLSDPQRYYLKFNLSGLLRGDAATRSAFYATMVNTGLLCPNEVRELEDRDPYEGGENFFMQGAMLPVDRVLNPPEPPAPVLPPPDVTPKAKQMHAEEVGRLNAELGIYKANLGQQAADIAAKDQEATAAKESAMRASLLVEQRERELAELNAARESDAVKLASASSRLSKAEQELQAAEAKQAELDAAVAAAECELSELRAKADAVSAALESNAAIFVSRMRGLLAMEQDWAIRAAKKPNFLAAMDKFYTSHQERVLEAVTPIIEQRNALAGTAIDAGLFVENCRTSSVDALLEACECQPDELATRIFDCVSTWEGRTEQLLEQLNQPTEANDADA